MKRDLPSIEGVYEKDGSKSSSKEFAKKVKEGVEAYKEAMGKKTIGATTAEIAGLIHVSQKTFGHWMYQGRKPGNDQLLIAFALVCVKVDPRLKETWVRELFEASPWNQMAKGYVERVIALVENSATTEQEAVQSVIEESSYRPINLWLNPEAQGIHFSDNDVDRPDELAKWRKLLCANNDEAHKRVIMWGMGGIGKTTLAKALLKDKEVKEYYFNGFLWAKLGPDETEAKKKVLYYLNRWCYLLGINPNSVEQEDSDLLRYKLMEEIKSQNLRLLIVIDDVWYPEHAKALLIDGVSALITSRKNNRLGELILDPGEVVLLKEMTPTEAVKLIKSRIKNWENNMEVFARQLAELVGYLPLALNIGAVLAQSFGWEHVLERLQSEMGNCTLEMPDKDQLREYSLNVTLDLSYNTLTENAQRIFHHLGLFPRNRIFKKDTPLLMAMWRSLFILYKDVTNFAWENASIELIEKALVIGEEGHFHLHKAVSDYAAKQASKASDALDAHVHFIITEWYYLHSMTYDPPREQARLMKEEWPDVVRAWGEIYKWRFDLSSKLDLARLTYEFSEMGCNVLGRLRQWDEIIQWTQEAQQIIGEDTNQESSRLYLEGLTIWQVDALLQKRQMGEAATLINKRREDSWVNSRQWWRLRYEIRRAHCLLNQKDLSEIEATIAELRDELISIKTIRAKKGPQSAQKERSRYIAYFNQVQEGPNFLPPFSLREDIEESWILEAEICWLLGDYADKQGQNPKKIESHWKNAVSYVTGSGFRCLTPCFVTDWWWMEGITVKVVDLLISCEKWDKAILVAQRWIEVRRILDLPVGKALIKITEWVISNGEQKFIDWVSTQLDLLAKSHDEQKLAIEDVKILQRGLRQAAQGEREEAAAEVKTVVASYIEESKFKSSCKRCPPIELPDNVTNDGYYEERFDYWLLHMLANNDLIATDEDGDPFRNRILQLSGPFEPNRRYGKEFVGELEYFRKYLT